MSDYLEPFNGRLHIVNVDTDTREPVTRRLYWPVLTTEGWVPCWYRAGESGEYCTICGQPKDSVGHRHALEPVAISGHDGRYGGTLANGARFTVTIDPRGQAVKIDETPIACPKVRKGIEVRYARGVWQKYLKSSGWVRA